MFANMPICWILNNYNAIIDAWDSLSRSQRRFARARLEVFRMELFSRGITEVFEDADGYIALV